MKSNDKELRLNAIALLIDADLKDNVYIQLISEKLSDPNNEVRLLSLESLGELKNEKIRADIFKNNAELREHLILKALSSEEKPQPRTDDAGLTPEQEKELDELISQVEEEIRKESSGRKKADPLGINQTWEEKNAGKRKKSKK